MFDSIGGLEKEINILKELFVSPFEFIDLYKKIENACLNKNIEDCKKYLIETTIKK